MTRDEIRLLLYVESRTVDDRSILHNRHISDRDKKILLTWRKSGYVMSGRLPLDIARRERTMWVIMSPQAFLDATEQRRLKSERSLCRLLKQVAGSKSVTGRRLEDAIKNHRANDNAQERYDQARDDLYVDEIHNSKPIMWVKR